MRTRTLIARPWEWLVHKLYGPAFNPTYQSGVLAVFLLALVLVTGVPLLFFYRVGSPYASVQGMQEQVYFARWLRALHRYASDAAVVAVAFHVARMVLGGRTFGPRTRAWISGIGLTLLMLFLGLTGLLMAWDSQAQRLALAAIGYLDGIPLFSEPPRRVFADSSNLGEAFFFMLMFLHVALPLVLTFGLWFHTSRLARPTFLPQRRLMVFYGLALTALAVLWPASLGPPADLQSFPGRTPLDWFYGFWAPPTEGWGRLPTLLLFSLATLVLTAVPWLDRPAQPIPPSYVDEHSCTGCTQCYQDCPYDAIQMVRRTLLADERHSTLVARVDPNLCVSCGICAGSCAPMGVGPSGRRGRDQLHAFEQWATGLIWRPGDVAVLACGRGAGETDFPTCQGLHFYATGCSGSLHTSGIELLLRRGATGVMVVSCPERDCSNREGGKWLGLRVYSDREAELQARVDRRRVRLLACPSCDAASAWQAARRFREELMGSDLGRLEPESERICRSAPDAS